MVPVLHTIVGAFARDLEAFEKKRHVEYKNSHDIVSERVARIKESAVYRRHLIALFLRFKSSKEVARESTLSKGLFLQIVSKESKIQSSSTEEQLFDWALSSEGVSFRLKQGLTLKQVKDLQKNKDITTTTLSKIVTIDLLLQENIGMTSADYDEVFVDLCSDYTILHNLLDSKIFLQQLGKVGFTKGLLKIVEKQNLDALDSFIQGTSSQFSEKLSMKIMFQESSLKNLGSSIQCTKYLIDKTDFAARVLSFLKDTDNSSKEVFYKHAPMIFAKYAETVPEFINFVTSHQIIKTQNAEKIFSRDLTAFQILINMKVWQSIGSFGVLEDRTSNLDKKLHWLDTIHPVAFHRWLFNEVAVKTIVDECVRTHAYTTLLFSYLSGDSILSIILYLEQNQKEIVLSGNAEDDANVIGILLRKISVVKLNREVALQKFSSLVVKYQNFITSNKDNDDFSDKINEAVRNLIYGGNINDDLFKKIHDTGIIGRDAQREYDNRMKVYVGEYEQVAVQPDAGLFSQFTTVVHNEPVNVRAHTNVGYQKVVVESTINKLWKYVDWGLGLICATSVYVNFATTSYNKAAVQKVVKPGTGNSKLAPAALDQDGTGVMGKLALCAASTVVLEGLRSQFSPGAEIKIVCPESGFCPKIDDNVEPIKCIVGEATCPDL